jgi:hypothetical protein
MPAAILEANQLQRDCRIALALGAVEARQQQRQFDVLLGRQHRHQVVELEDETDVVAAPGRQLPGAHRVDALPVDVDLTAAGRIQSADQVEQRGLARTRRAHQCDEVALLDVQVDAVQNLDLFRAALVGLGEVANADQCRHGSGVRSVDVGDRDTSVLLRAVAAFRCDKHA